MAYRFGLAPTTLTLANLVLGLSAGGIVIVFWGEVSPVALGLSAALMWHVAYGLDCADGQLSRFTGRTSPSGKRVDILCDVALQITFVAAIARVASEFAPLPEAWFIAAFAGTWQVGLLTSTFQEGETAGDILSHKSPFRKFVTLLRDYSLHVTVLGLVLAFAAHWTIWFMCSLLALNTLYLFTSIFVAARVTYLQSG